MRSADRNREPLRDAAIKSELQRLGLSFPLWLFDPTSEVHPRRLDSIPAGSRPARISGWGRGYWEYGMLLGKVDLERRNANPTGKTRSVDDVLKRIRFDDTLEDADYEAVVDGGSVFTVPELAQKKVPSSRVKTIKRIWDDAIFWDKAARFDAFFDAEKEGFVCVGLAVKVEDVQHLARIAGVHEKNVEDVPAKAQFEFTDEEGGTVKGIVYNGRHHMDRGIISAATKDYNDQFLRGTDREDELGTIGRSD